MAGDGLHCTLITPADRRETLQTDVNVRTVVPRWARKWPFRPTNIITQRRAETILLQNCRSEQGRAAAYLWGNVSAGLGLEIKATGAVLVREKFNCAMRVAREILQRAYAGLNASAHFPNDVYDDRLMHAEMESLKESDLIYCPSPMVAWSLEEIGIERSRMVMTSYGFDPARLSGDHQALSVIDAPTFIFVGYICVRKGAHLLLEAWRRAGARGRLVLLGKVEPMIADRFADVLARPDVEHHPFARDVGSYYRSADYFIFPSLEEGSPLVTYEAAFCGLPSIVSRMGAGAIVRDGIDGVIVDCDDIKSWTDAIANAAAGGKPAADQARQIRERSMQFTWDRVGAQRREQLVERL